MKEFSYSGLSGKNDTHASAMRYLLLVIAIMVCTVALTRYFDETAEAATDVTDGHHTSLSNATVLTTPQEPACFPMLNVEFDSTRTMLAISRQFCNSNYIPPELVDA